MKNMNLPDNLKELVIKKIEEILSFNYSGIIELINYEDFEGSVSVNINEEFEIEGTYINVVLFGDIVYEIISHTTRTYELPSETKFSDSGLFIGEIGVYDKGGNEILTIIDNEIKKCH
jgi:hypothetical protein